MRVVVCVSDSLEWRPRDEYQPIWLPHNAIKLNICSSAGSHLPSSAPLFHAHSPLFTTADRLHPPSVTLLVEPCPLHYTSLACSPFRQSSSPSFSRLLLSFVTLSQQPYYCNPLTIQLVLFSCSPLSHIATLLPETLFIVFTLPI